MITYSIATSADFPHIVSLLQSAHGDTSNTNHIQFIIAKDEDKLVGCVRIKELAKDCLELASLAVLEQYRGKGVGSKLIAKILGHEKRKPIYLLCFLDKKRFYIKSGFEIIPISSLPEILRLEYDRVYEKLKDSKLEIIAMAQYQAYQVKQ